MEVCEMKTAVVILNWNGRSMLERYLPSVVKYTAGDACVVIADNGSTDDSLAFVERNYPSVQIIRHDKNYGFAEGYNRALAQVEAEYYVLLNDDVEVTPGWIEPITELFEKEPEVAVCQPKLLMDTQRDTFEYAGASGGFIDAFGYPYCRGRVFTTIEKDNGQYDDECEVMWATGAAMFVRASVWREMGGLDGDFFAHMEEIDFCWRVRNAGYRVMSCPRSKVFHLGGGTLPKSSPKKTYLNFRNNLSMLYKNLPSSRLIPVVLMRLPLDWVAALKFIADGNPQDFLAVGRAHRDFFSLLPQLRVKRKTVINQVRARKGQMTGSRHCSRLLLIDYYILRKKFYSQLKWNEKQE